MKNSILLFLFFIFSNSFSQNTIQISYETDSRGYYVFYCKNNDFCNYILELHFSELTNLSTSFGDTYKNEVRPGKNKLFELRTRSAAEYATFKYTCSYFKGCYNPIINSDFSYLIPVGSGKETETIELKNIKVNSQDPNPKNFYSIAFKMKQGDTVYAARRGIVTELKESGNLNLSGYIYSSDESFIEIYHDDCSFGKYQVFSSILVKQGQKVEAGDPIGLAGGEKYEIGPHVRFWVNYNYEQLPEGKKKTGSIKNISWAYVPLLFYSKEEGSSKLLYSKTYTSEHPDSLITLEMTKRQVEKWKKNRYSSQ